MRKINIKSFLLSAFLMVFAGSMPLTSCSNEQENIVEGRKIGENKEGITFKLEFMDFGKSDTISTRAAKSNVPDTLMRDTVSINNGLIAEVCMVRDTAKSRPLPEVKTRALSNGTYTIYAYQGNTLKGTLKGTVSSGIFTSTSVNKEIVLTPGVYTFVCCNDKVNFDGGTQLLINRADAGTAMIGRVENVTINPSPRHQEVTFQMKHVGTRVKSILLAYAPIPAGFKAHYHLRHSPTVGHFEMPTGHYYNETGEFIPGQITFNTSTEPAGSAQYSAWGQQETFFLQATPGNDLWFQIDAGNIYKKSAMGGKQLNLNPAIVTMAPGASYVINIRLVPQFLYLMNDGSVAITTDVPAKQAVGLHPVGLVLSQVHRMAVALNDAPHVEYYQLGQQFHNITIGRPYSFYVNDMDGENYTWNPAYMADQSVYGIIPQPIKANMLSHPAFPGMYPAIYNTAAHYVTTPRIGALAGRNWYLPTIGEWKFLAYLFSDNISLSHDFVNNYSGIQLNTNLMDLAFNTFGGQRPNGNYWTSSETSKTSSYSTFIHDSYFSLLNAPNPSSVLRSFIHY